MEHLTLNQQSFSEYCLSTASDDIWPVLNSYIKYYQIRNCNLFALSFSSDVNCGKIDR